MLYRTLLFYLYNIIQLLYIYMLPQPSPKFFLGVINTCDEKTAKPVIFRKK